jgi:hypothetical protein
MYTIAAKHARSEMVRCRPPYGGRGGTGSSGSTSAHNSSGTSSSMRVVMAPDLGRPNPKERNDVLGALSAYLAAGEQLNWLLPDCYPKSPTGKVQPWREPPTRASDVGFHGSGGEGI